MSGRKPDSIGRIISSIEGRGKKSPPKEEPSKEEYIKKKLSKSKSKKDKKKSKEKPASAGQQQAPAQGAQQEGIHLDSNMMAQFIASEEIVKMKDDQLFDFIWKTWIFTREGLGEVVFDLLNGEQKEDSKDAVKAKIAYDLGVKSFDQGNDGAALEWLSKAIGLAPYEKGTQQEDSILAQALFKRSQVHAKMNNYELVATDNNQYFKVASSDATIYQTKINQGFAYAILEKFEYQILILEDLLKNHDLQPNVREIIKQNLANSKHRFTGDQKQLGPVKPKSGMDDEAMGFVGILTDCVDIVSDEKQGKRLICTKDVQKNKVLILERPLVSQVYLKYCLIYCNHCTYKVSTRFIPCHSCNKAVYCSEECRVKAWDEFHKIECKFLGFISRMPNQSCHLVLQLLGLIGPENALRIHKEGKIRDDERNNITLLQFEKFIQFKDHREQKPPKLLADLVVQSTFICYLVEYLKLVKLDDEAARKNLFSFFFTNQLKCIVNGYGLCSEKFKVTSDYIGNGIVIFATYIRHSCEPNAEWFVTDNRMDVIAFKDIKKDEEIFINYGIDKKWTFERRQAVLQEKYHFICKCSLCKRQAHERLSLKCPKCGGAVIYGITDFNDDKAVCFDCGTKYEGAMYAVNMIKEHKHIIEDLDKNFEKVKAEGKEDPKEKVMKCTKVFYDLLHPESIELKEVKGKINSVLSKIK